MATTLFTGTFDQSYIPHAIAYSACLGEHAQRCKGTDNYTRATSCVNQQEAGVGSVSVSGGGGSPVVIASSVMADDGARSKSSASNEIAAHFVWVLVIASLEFAVT